jgi:hypothetical protein
MLNNLYNDAWCNKLIEILDEIDCDMFFAAGNAGNLTTSFPQVKLNRKSDRIHIIGSCDIYGVPSKFSSCADLSFGKYVDCLYLGELSASLHPVTGNTTIWNGTSSATPHALGDARAKNLTGKALKDYWRKLVLTDATGDGLPDGVNADFAETIRLGNWLPKIGVGVCEMSRQENMKKSGLGLLTGVPRAEIASLQAEYQDFDKIDRLA